MGRSLWLGCSDAVPGIPGFGEKKGNWKGKGEKRGMEWGERGEGRGVGKGEEERKERPSSLVEKLGKCGPSKVRRRQLV